MPAGRPTKYKEEYCDMLIDHMAEGYSFETFGAVVDVCKDTLYEWVKVHEEFSDAFKRAKLKCQMTWEKAGGIDALSAERFNAGLYKLHMVNRFGWADKKEVSVPEDSSIKIEYKLKDS